MNENKKHDNRKECVGKKGKKKLSIHTRERKVKDIKIMEQEKKDREEKRR